MSEEEREDEWRFSVDEFDDSPPPAETDAPTESGREGHGTQEDPGDEEGDANVAGEFSPSAAVVPERPGVENAAFVTLGAVLAILALTSLIVPSFGLVDALTVVLVVGSLGAVVYGAFARLTPDT